MALSHERLQKLIDRIVDTHVHGVGKGEGERGRRVNKK